MNTRSPDISVMIPTYNRAATLRIAIASALRQKDVTIEVLVTDDNSPDNTEQVVKSFRDKRIRYIKNIIRLGTSENFSKSFLACKGHYIFTLSDDDLLLEDTALADVLRVMKKYRVGIGKIGTIGYEITPFHPYQTYILSDRRIVLKPSMTPNILVQSIDFGIGLFSGYAYDANRMSRKLLKLDHICYPDHMCYVFLPMAFDLIQKYGMAYIPKHFIVSRLSLELIPRYFDIRTHGGLFIEEPITLSGRFIHGKRLLEYTKKFLRAEMVLLPNVKYFSNYGNYIQSLKIMIRRDNTLVTDIHFIFWSLMGLLPNFIITFLRYIKVYQMKRQILPTLKKYNYAEKIAAINADIGLLT